MKRNQNTIKLNPNSEYHRILVKNLGEQGALEALYQSNLAYAMASFNYKTANKYKPKKVFAR